MYNTVRCTNSSWYKLDKLRLFLYDKRLFIEWIDRHRTEDFYYSLIRSKHIYKSFKFYGLAFINQGIQTYKTNDKNTLCIWPVMKWKEYTFKVYNLMHGNLMVYVSCTLQKVVVNHLNAYQLVRTDNILGVFSIKDYQELFNGFEWIVLFLIEKNCRLIFFLFQLK